MSHRMISQVSDTGMPIPHTQPEVDTEPDKIHSMIARKGMIRIVRKQML